VLRRHSPPRWRELHEELADHYDARREGLDDTGEAALRLEVESAYHRLCARGAAAVPRALVVLVDVFSWQPELTPVTVAALGEGAQLSGDPEAAPIPKRLLELGSSDLRGTPLLDALLATGLLDDECRAIVLGERGELHMLAGRHDLALADLDLALDLAPRLTWLVAYRGNAHRCAGRLAEAMLDLDRAIERFPTYHWCLAVRARAHVALGDNSAAVTDLTAAIDLAPGEAGYLVDRAEAYFNQGEYDSALGDCRRAAAVAPDNAEAHRVRARFHATLDEYDHAVLAIDAALALSPDDGAALSLRGSVALRQGRTTEARADLDRGVECAPDDSWVVGRRGEFHLETGDPRSAEADLRRSVELDPENTWAHFLLEVARAVREGRPAQLAEPLRICADLLAREPGEAYLASNHAVILAVSGGSQAGDLVPAAAKRHELLELVHDFEQARRLLGFDAEPYLEVLRRALG
jgi:tetratricopeptide (TPR) repeat protein